MAKFENIIIHCSDSPWGNAKAIDEWHKARGWKCIGYHYVILNGHPEPHKEYDSLKDGVIEPGRPLNDDNWVTGNEIGSHCLGYNDKSAGICLIGQTAPIPTDAQMNALIGLCRHLMNTHGIPVENILGHCETASGKAEGKTCPNFDVQTLRDLLI